MNASLFHRSLWDGLVSGHYVILFVVQSKYLGPLALKAHLLPYLFFSLTHVALITGRVVCVSPPPPGLFLGIWNEGEGYRQKMGGVV